VTETRRIVLAVSGASGMPYALTLARALAAAPGVQTHLIISDAARVVLARESDATPGDLAALAHAVHDAANFAAPPSSGSWRHAGMVVCPCSMSTLAAIASGAGANLIHRAADVTLKERRPLLLVTRETPLSRIHIENMLRATDAGATIFPASPGFYHRPASAQDIVDHLCGRILDNLGIPQALARPWEG
jgi:4-hydroxy-3-polyprenylbenzoate decarboxylase